MTWPALSISHASAPPAPQTAATSQTPDTDRQLQICISRIRDIAFDADVSVALAEAIFAQDKAMPPGPAGDAARLALAELLQPFPESPADRPFNRTGQQRQPPPDILGDIAGWPVRREALARPAILAQILGSNPTPRPDVADVDRLWRHYVSCEATDGRQAVSPDPGLSLLRFARAYLRKNGRQDPAIFFLPFRKLAQQCISDIERAPGAQPFFHLVGAGLESKAIPFDTLCRWADACEAEAAGEPGQAPEFLLQPQRHSYWEITLRALCSPLSLGLLAHGRIDLDTLVSWLGVDTRISAGQPRNRSPFADRLAYFLASPRIGDVAHCASALENPGLIRLLADAHIPVPYAAALLEYAGSVEPSVLESEINRVVALYADPDGDAADDGREFMRAIMNRPGDAERIRLAMDMRRANANYGNCFETQILLPSEERDWAETKAHLAPHQQLARRRGHPRLNMGKIATIRAADGTVHPTRILVTASTLFAEWAAQGLATQQQIRMADFLVQGFDSPWAHRTVQTYAGQPDRLDAWFDGTEALDLAGFLDDAMKAAIDAWLADTSIENGVLGWIAPLILCRLDTTRIGHILHTESGSSNTSRDDGNTTRTLCRIADQIRYGVLTPAGLWAGLERDGGLRRFCDGHADIPSSIPPLRIAIGDTLAHLRVRVQRLKAIQRALSPDSLGWRHCDALLQSRLGAIAALDALLGASLEDDIRRHPGDVEASLLRLSAMLNFTDPAAPIPAASRRAADAAAPGHWPRA